MNVNIQVIGETINSFAYRGYSKYYSDGIIEKNTDNQFEFEIKNATYIFEKNDEDCILYLKNEKLPRRIQGFDEDENLEFLQEILKDPRFFLNEVVIPNVRRCHMTLFAFNDNLNNIAKSSFVDELIIYIQQSINFAEKVNTKHTKRIIPDTKSKSQDRKKNLMKMLSLGSIPSKEYTLFMEWVILRLEESRDFFDEFHTDFYEKKQDQVS